MPKNKILVDYTSREFNSIKQDLEDHARLYYPDSYKDFSENSFGSYILDTVAYVGDMLSFYLDYQVNESFLETAVEYDNITRLTKNIGYKTPGRPAAFGMATFYVGIPANSSGLGPNRNLLPILKAGAEMTTDDGTSFVLLEDVDFSNPKNEMVSSKFSRSTGNATEFAIRAYGQVKSTALFRTTLGVTGFKKFLRLKVGPSSIQEIKSVFDSEGHQYYEVEDLSQDTIYVNTPNPNYLEDGVPQIIKPKIVKRKFVVVRDANGTYLQFGGSSDVEPIGGDIADPSQAVLKMAGRSYITDSSFDPKKLFDTKTLGISPKDTVLTVMYYNNSSDSVNVAASSIKTMITRPLVFPSGRTSDFERTEVINSLEVSNETPIVGNTTIPSAEELRYRAYAERSSQSRAVTRNDYEAMCYMMPSKFGGVKRASIINDPSSSNRRLSLYVVSVDDSNNLLQTNGTVKQNLKNWLNKSKMLNDNIDIYDAKIINLGFNYEIIVDPTRDKTMTLNTVQEALVNYLSEKRYIGEPFYLTEIFNTINKVDGVVDTTKITPVLKVGNNYSNPTISILDIKSNDGTYLRAPKNVIYEIKFPTTDIKGTAI